MDSEFNDPSVSCATNDNLDSSKSNENDQLTTFEQLVEWFVDTDPWQIKRYVGGLRQRYPSANEAELARKVVGLKSLKNGFVGAATGIPGFLAVPLTVPTDLIVSWKIQINMALCIAHIYGHTIDMDDPENDIKTDVYLILAGKSAKECLNVMGIQVDTVTKRTIRRYVARELTIELWKYLGRKIISAAGVRSVSRMSRAVPLLGAPIGFAFDYAAARSVGECACEYYADVVDAEADIVEPAHV